jgi:hypothetical protein
MKCERTPRACRPTRATTATSRRSTLTARHGLGGHCAGVWRALRARPRAFVGWSARARVALHRRAVSGQAVRACGRRSRGNRRRLDERHDWLGGSHAGGHADVFRARRLAVAVGRALRRAVCAVGVRGGALVWLDALWCAPAGARQPHGAAARRARRASRGRGAVCWARAGLAPLADGGARAGTRAVDRVSASALCARLQQR